MKTITKIAAGALVACGLAVAVAAPADAGVRIGIGLPFIAAAPSPATCYDYYGRPYYCGYSDYYAPGYVGFTFGGHDRDWHGHDFHRDHDGERR